jgi:hypothetical protein
LKNFEEVAGFLGESKYSQLHCSSTLGLSKLFGFVNTIEGIGIPELKMSQRGAGVQI